MKNARVGDRHGIRARARVFGSETPLIVCNRAGGTPIASVCRRCCRARRGDRGAHDGDPRGLADPPAQAETVVVAQRGWVTWTRCRSPLWPSRTGSRSRCSCATVLVLLAAPAEAALVGWKAFIARRICGTERRIVVVGAPDLSVLGMPRVIHHVLPSHVVADESLADRWISLDAGREQVEHGVRHLALRVERIEERLRLILERRKRRLEAIPDAGDDARPTGDSGVQNDPSAVAPRVRAVELAKREDCRRARGCVLDQQ